MNPCAKRRNPSHQVVFESMKNPNDTYDRSMLREEPLRSFFTNATFLKDENDPQFKEKQEMLILDLAKDGNIQAVRTWRELAFPARHAPPVEESWSDNTALNLFVIFQWKLHRKCGAKDFLEQERVNRGYPRICLDVTMPSNSRTNKTDLPGKNKHVETQSALEQKPLKPTTSHVTKNKYSAFRFSRNVVESKPEIITQDENNQNAPPFMPALPPSATPTCTQASSSKTMQDSYPVLDTRASSPLSECESVLSTTHKAFETRVTTDSRASSPLSECESVLSTTHTTFDTRVATEAPTDASPSTSKKVLDAKGNAARAKSKKRKDFPPVTGRRVSARLNGSAPKQSLTAQNLAVEDGSARKKVAPGMQKTLPKDFTQSVQKSPSAAINYQSLSVKKELLDFQISPSGFALARNSEGSTKRQNPDSKSQTNASKHVSSPKEQDKWNITSTRKTLSNPLLQNTSTLSSPIVSSTRSKRAPPVIIQSPKSISAPNVIHAHPKSESKPHIKEPSDRLERLRPRILDSSGNPTYVLPPQSPQKQSGSHNLPVKRKKDITFGPSKKQKPSKVEKQGTLQFPVGRRRSAATKLNGEFSLQSKGTQSPKKVGKKASAEKTSHIPIKAEDSPQESSLPLEPEAASIVVTTSPSSMKRKRNLHPGVTNKNVKTLATLDGLKETDDSLSHEEPPSKKRKRATRQSAKEISKRSDDNERQPLAVKNLAEPTSIPESSLAQTNSEPCPQLDIEIKTNSSNTAPNSEDHISMPTNTAGEPVSLHTPNTELLETVSTIYPPRDDTRHNGPEITKHFKEELLETSILTETRLSPVHSPFFQEDEEEIDPSPSDDLLSLEEADKQFAYPDEHPDNYCRFPKPPLQMLPPIWAESRQELCESFDWFRSYQGGVYHAHNVTKGYLLSGFPASRDRFEHGGRLIISHGGGRAESIHCHKGRLESQPATDQLAQDKSVRALFDNYVNNRPLALVMDDRYALFPYDLRAKNVTYAVLGFYTIADAWAEYQSSNNESGRVIRYKFAFRWCDDQGPPWWEQHGEEQHGEDGIYQYLVDEFDSKMATSEMPKILPDSLLPADAQEEEMLLVDEPEQKHDIRVSSTSETQVTLRDCQDRKCPSCLKIFLQIFSAWTCLNPQCFKFWKNGRLLPISMGYNPKFLELGPSKPIPVGFGRLEPISALALPKVNLTMYAFTRGFHCYNCGRLSCRDKWEKWECMNTLCKASQKITGNPREAASLLHQSPAIAFKDYTLNPISDIQQLLPASFKHDNGRGFVQTFILPYENAKIHHIKSGNFRGREEADSIFIDYQQQATSGDLRFRRWPMRAHKCRGSLLTNYFSQNTGVPYKYVGGDENTVPFAKAPGAVVRARDLIQRRVMQALDIPIEFNEVLSAAYMERQKMAFHSDDEVGLGPFVAGLSLGSPALMHFRLHAKHDPDREKRGILLSIVLRHGDILVMDGAAVQEYYEHTVVPTNFRIAATARYIGADHA